MSQHWSREKEEKLMANNNFRKVLGLEVERLDDGEGEGVLKVEGISKRFGGLTAVNNVSFEVNEGEILAIIGPNGAGKTTLMNLISGFLKPDDGHIYFNNMSIVGMQPHVIAQKGLVRSFQTIEMFNMTVRDSLITAALLRKPLKACYGFVDDLMDRLGLAHRADYTPDHLSLPDKKLLEIGKCLAVEPQVILFDEVMSGLTLAEAQVPINIIKGLKESGLSIIIVEHVMPIVMELADRIVVISFGEKIAEGTPREIVENEQVQQSYLGGRI